MSKIKWSDYLDWREKRSLNNADIMIFVGSEVEIKSRPVIVDGERVVQIQVGKANLLVPTEMIEE